MLSLLLTLLILWLCFKLGIGLIKFIGVLIIIGLIFAFISYLAIPILSILAVAGLLGLFIKN